MAELPFLDAVATYLSGASLTPAPTIVGMADPLAGSDLPAVTLSLEACEREQTGVGKRRSNERRHGVLARTVTVDLAHPTLADDPTFSLVDAADATRRTFILPHGGLVRADGSTGPITGADLKVTITAGGPPSSPAVSGNPTPPAGQVFASAADGVLTFGSGLPATGTIKVDYSLGSWEQELIRIHGVLRVDVSAKVTADARALSDRVATALLADGARRSIKRLYTMQLTALSSIGAAALTGTPGAVRRTARFGFLFEHELDTPDSSGRRIRTIPVHAEFFPPEADH